MRTSFHHQPEAQHPRSPAIETPAGRLPHLSAKSGHPRVPAAFHFALIFWWVCGDRGITMRSHIIIVAGLAGTNVAPITASLTKGGRLEVGHVE